MSARSENIEKLNELIKDVKIAMLVTHDEDGTLRSRPMMTQDAEFDGDLWFFTREHSPKVEEAQGQQVNLSYAKPEDNTFVSVSGTAHLVLDRAKIEEYWNPVLKAWFPEGLDDPELALLKVEVQKAEYWKSPSGITGMVANSISLAKALATGTQADMGENEKIEF